jgi:hypothetical protein
MLRGVAITTPPPIGTVIPGYTRVVKTAISIPDDTFTRAERRARMLGITRSQFYTRAAQRYLDELDATSLTRQIDETIEMVGSDESATLASAAGRRRLEQVGEDDW